MHRIPDVTSFANAPAPEILDRVNDAIGEVVEGRTWDFQKRDDGILNTVASVTNTSTGSVTNNSATAVISNYGPTFLTIFNQKAQFLVTGDSSFSETPLRITSAATNGAGSTLTLEDVFRGTTNASAAWRTFAYEYVLPDTVRTVISCRYQEQPLRLAFVESDYEFYEHYPRPHDDIDSTPDLIVIGGSGETTYNADSASEGTQGLLARVWPVPSAAQVIHYNYIYSPARMTATTDELRGVPERIINMVVQLAYALSLQSGIGNDPTTGLLLEQRTIKAIQRLYATQKPDPYRRRPLQSLDNVIPSPREVGRVPRIVESL
jgi:hypothetical protein